MLFISCEGNGSVTLALQILPSDRNQIALSHDYTHVDKIRSMLGWKPKVPLAEGLARTVAFYRQHLSPYP